MRRLASLLAATVGLAVLPASASAAPTGGVEAGTDPGGAAFDPEAPEPLRIAAARLTPATVALRVEGSAPTVRVRLDLVAAGSRTAVKRVSLGTRRTGRPIRIAWRPRLSPGEYAARLHATAPDGQRARRAIRARLRIAAPPPPSAPAPPAASAAPPAAPARPGSFPLQGAYAFGGDDARFGAGRPGHSHQGQDLVAAEGIPIVSPVAGVVQWRAYHSAGAGHYLVIRSPGLGDHAYMHLRAGSIAVVQGAAVGAGERIAEVGSTGRSSGPHLHFELWPNGWWEAGSHPIDPRPQLDAWAAGR